MGKEQVPIKKTDEKDSPVDPSGILDGYDDVDPLAL